MSGIIEFDAVDALTAGAVGQPGERMFLIQARKNDAEITVVVEKQQVALLAREVVSFLNRVAGEYPEADSPLTSGPRFRELGDTGPDSSSLPGPDLVDAAPLFRARLIGLGFDPSRDLVLLELRENAPDDDTREGDAELFAADEPSEPPTPGHPSTHHSDDDEDDGEGFVARIFATRPQVRAMAAVGTAAVAAGRPVCDLCDQPIDPDGHVCPRMN